MDARGRPSFSELKVGIFVLVSIALLAVAIFTIGRQVGLFEETFAARTYLNNVSGLKPGDVVLLGGVEVGNVRNVIITPAGELPPTETNQRLTREIQERSRELSTLEQRIDQTRQNLDESQADLDAAVEQHGARSRQARLLRREVDTFQEQLNNQQNRLENIQQDIDTSRANLQNIVVTMEIQTDHRGWIRKDSSISLGSIGLLGDKYIDISLGRGSDAPEEKEGFVEITGTTQPGFQELITGADDVLANVETLSNRLADIMFRISEGEGTVGRFLTDTSFYNNLNETMVGARGTVDEASRLINDLRTGEGTFARIVQEREVYDKISTATARLEEVLDRVEQGEGTLGKFVNDPAIYEKSDQIAANVQSITQRMDSGEGTLGKLSTDDQLYENLKESLSRFSAFVEDIEQGQGTLGRLAQDEALYQNLNQVSTELVKLLYDIRQNPKKFLTIKLELF